jgi:carboxypeptidase Q
MGLAPRTQELRLDAWDRGMESLAMLAPIPGRIAVLGLGNSVPGTVEAKVSVVRRWEDLGPHVKGTIVLYDTPMGEGLPTIAHYGEGAQYRVRGAIEAARHGAVAALVRSVTTRSLDTPHTGMMRYEDGVPRIPSAAIPTEQADRIARMVAAGTEVRLRLALESTTRADVASANVLAEIKGRTDEVVVLGAHLDSWDVGCGAHDDGAGVVEVMEAMRRLRALGQTPQRTIRAVLYANEERGLHGGRTYRDSATRERHVAAVESDLGGGNPLAWAITGTEAQRAWFGAIAAPTGLPVDATPGGGADIGPLEDLGTLLVGLRPDDTHYFDVHHTEADTLDKIDPAALSRASGAMAAVAWMLANAPAEPPKP